MANHLPAEAVQPVAEQVVLSGGEAGLAGQVGLRVRAALGSPGSGKVALSVVTAEIIASRIAVMNAGSRLHDLGQMVVGLPGYAQPEPGLAGGGRP